MAEEIIPEWKMALEELSKYASKGMPENKVRKKVVKGLMRQGIDKQKAEGLTDWAIKQHQETRVSPEEMKRFQEIGELIQLRLNEGKSKRQIIEELVSQGLDERIAEVRTEVGMNIIQLKKIHQSIYADFKKKEKESKFQKGILLLVVAVLVLAVKLTGAFSKSSNPAIGLLIMVGVILLGGILVVIIVSSRI